MDEFAEQTGRKYSLFEYFGAPDAENVIVLMGSGCDTVHEAVEYLNHHGNKTGVLKVRLYRPFDGKRFVEALPPFVRKIAVLDRTKEPGAMGEPLYQDCLTAILEEMSAGRSRLKFLPKIISGRYGLSSKEFTPAMIKAVFANLEADAPKNHFTVGINDDVSNTSLLYDAEFSTEPESVVRALFYGLGADGTVGANKNSIKIIGEETDNFAQGYFVYDSKKSGSITTSHLRFGPRPIRSAYLVTKANFVACHQPGFLERYEMLRSLVPGGTFLLNTPYAAEHVWSKLPTPVQESLLARKAKLFVIDATRVAKDSGMGGRINTIMQVCFFALSGVLPKDQAIELEPYDTVTVQGFYRSQPEVNDAITKAAKEKGAYSFFIVRQVDANQGGNQRITAFIYKKDAKKRVLQSPDAIPANSEAGRAAIAKGGEAAKKVEIPGVATTAAPSAEVGRFFETQSTKGGRYSVTLPDGTKIEELNNATAAQMVPFDSIKFTGNYGNMTEVSYQVAKRAAKKGAKYYHITRQWQERGNNVTISADLYK
jgi:Pyruvate/2-oxoacid:ferredoxin oxidoreductase gamma subunit